MTGVTALHDWGQCPAVLTCATIDGMRNGRETPTIEPGLVQVFRLFEALRFALQVLTLFSRSATPAARVRRYPAFGLVETGFLLVLLTWRWPRERLGRLYLPIALFVASAGPIIEHALTAALRALGGATRLEAGSDFWQLIIVLVVPLVLASWQYGFGSVLLFCAGTSLLDLTLGVPVAVVGGPRWVTTLGIVFVRSLLYALVGYVVARLVAAQRVQRAELAQANAQLAHYATTVERLAVSHERNRLARELHDTLAHTLSAVAVQLEAMDALWDRDLTAARLSLNKAQALTHNGLQETRRALGAMRARPLEDLGLALAVRRLAEQGAERAGFSLKIDIAVDLGSLRPEVEQTVYRVAEEAVTNAVRHANAGTLAVTLRRQDGMLILEVTDDGRGFDPSGQRGDGRYGLVGMRERAALCGGQLDIASQPGRGTTVRLAIEDKE
jgi:signal transduction histidine kinase